MKTVLQTERSFKKNTSKRNIMESDYWLSGKKKLNRYKIRHIKLHSEPEHFGNRLSCTGYGSGVNNQKRGGIKVVQIAVHRIRIRHQQPKKGRNQ